MVVVCTLCPYCNQRTRPFGQEIVDGMKAHVWCFEDMSDSVRYRKNPRR